MRRKHISQFYMLKVSFNIFAHLDLTDSVRGRLTDHSFDTYEVTSNMMSLLFLI